MSRPFFASFAMTQRLVSSFSLLFVCFALVAAEPAQLTLPEVEPVKLSPLAVLEGPAGKKEVSGLVASRQWPGVYWVHNDSGDETRIYPVGRDGRLKVSARTADAPGVLVGGVVDMLGVHRA